MEAQARPPAAPPPPSTSPDMLTGSEPQTITSEMIAQPEAFPEAETDDARRDFEKGMPLAPALTLTLIVANVVVFAILLAKGALESQEAIIQAGALSRPHVLGSPPLTSPEPWRLVSSMFLHGGFDHLFGNCIALYILGMACEHAYGLGRLGLLYGLSGIGASVLSIFLSPGPSVGASGAIFGLMGAAIVFFRKYGKQFYVRDNRVGIVLIIWAIYSIAIGLTQPFIDNGAHVGGLLTGILVAMFVRPGILDLLGMPAQSEDSIVPRTLGS